MIFWAIAFFLTLIAILFAVLPLLSHNNRQHMSNNSTTQKHHNANLASFQEQRTDIQLRVANNTLSQEDAASLTLELEKKLLADIPNNKVDKTTTSYSHHMWLVLLLTFAIPAVALLAYIQLGARTEVAVFDKLQNSDAPAEEVALLLEDWADKKPENNQAQYLLGVQYLSMGLLDKAVRTYRKLYVYSDKHPQISAQLAQVLFLSENKNISEEIRKLYQEALTMDAKNTTALGLKGIDSFDKGRYSEAANAWQIASELENLPHIKQALKSGVNKARQMMGENIPQIIVKVDIVPELKVLPKETRVIVFARETGVKGAPIAALPATVGELPKEFIIDDTSAIPMMTEQRLLTDISQLDVVAKITLSGDAMHSDYQATATGIDPKAGKVIELTIGTETPLKP